MGNIAVLSYARVHHKNLTPQPPSLLLAGGAGKPLSRVGEGLGERSGCIALM